MITKTLFDFGTGYVFTCSLTNTGNGYVVKFTSVGTEQEDAVCLSYQQAEVLFMTLKDEFSK